MSAPALRALSGVEALPTLTKSPPRLHVVAGGAAPASAAAPWKVRRPRGRVHPNQLALPFPRSSRGQYNGLEACAIEAALGACRKYSEGSARHRVEVALLVDLVLPEVVKVAASVWQRSSSLSREDLVQEGVYELYRVKAWQRFTPGRAGRARSLFPKYVAMVARQGMGRAVKALGRPVHVTRWSERTGKVQEAPTGVGLEAAAHVASTCEEELSERMEQARAVEALKKLARPMRLAVAAPLGLLREGTLSDFQVGRRL
ncbi:hypothetical protein, partial [Hyalangium sp.]|uniref:hypothetical protein n=1 Tax=Hyalangium sp. TaxID=2028555 RepID=UPI002D5ED8E1